MPTPKETLNPESPDNFGLNVQKAIIQAISDCNNGISPKQYPAIPRLDDITKVLSSIELAEQAASIGKGVEGKIALGQDNEPGKPPAPQATPNVAMPGKDESQQRSHF